MGYTSISTPLARMNGLSNTSNHRCLEECHLHHRMSSWHEVDYIQLSVKRPRPGILVRSASFPQRQSSSTALLRNGDCQTTSSCLYLSPSVDSEQCATCERHCEKNKFTEYCQRFKQIDARYQKGKISQTYSRFKLCKFKSQISALHSLQPSNAPQVSTDNQLLGHGVPLRDGGATCDDSEHHSDVSHSYKSPRCSKTRTFSTDLLQNIFDGSMPFSRENPSVGNCGGECNLRLTDIASMFVGAYDSSEDSASSYVGYDSSTGENLARSDFSVNNVSSAGESLMTVSDVCPETTHGLSRSGLEATGDTNYLHGITLSHKDDDVTCSYFYDDEFEGTFTEPFPFNDNSSLQAGYCTLDGARLFDGTNPLSGYSSAFASAMQLSEKPADSDCNSVHTSDTYTPEEGVTHFFAIPTSENYTLTFGAVSTLSLESQLHSEQLKERKTTTAIASQSMPTVETADVPTCQSLASSDSARRMHSCRRQNISPTAPTFSSQENRTESGMSCLPKKPSATENGESYHKQCMRAQTIGTIGSSADDESYTLTKDNSFNNPSKAANIRQNLVLRNKLTSNFTAIGGFGDLRIVTEAEQIKNGSLPNIDTKFRTPQDSQQELPDRNCVSLAILHTSMHAESDPPTSENHIRFSTHRTCKENLTKILNCLPSPAEGASCQSDSLGHNCYCANDGSLRKVASQKRSKVGSEITHCLGLPDVTYLRHGREQICSTDWWAHLLEEPSFCKVACQSRQQHGISHLNNYAVFYKSSDTCRSSDRKCQSALVQQLLMGNGSQRAYSAGADSSGIATGSSDATPKDARSCRMDYGRRRSSELTSSLDPTIKERVAATFSDDQCQADILSCLEASDDLVQLVAQTDHSFQDVQRQLLIGVWKLSSAIESIVSLGMKSHKTTTVKVGRVQTRLRAWDIVEASASTSGQAMKCLSSVLKEVRNLAIQSDGLRMCLFVCGLLRAQCLDFWLQVLYHNEELLDKYYSDVAIFKSRTAAKRSVVAELTRSIHKLSLYTFDLDPKAIIDSFKEVPAATCIGSCYDTSQDWARHNYKSSNAHFFV